jgi:hypothetical protein
MSNRIYFRHKERGTRAQPVTVAPVPHHTQQKGHAMHSVTSIAHPPPSRSSELSLPLAYIGTFRGTGGWFLKDWRHQVWFVSSGFDVQALDRSDAPWGWHAPTPEDAKHTHALLLRVREAVDCTLALARQWA